MVFNRNDGFDDGIINSFPYWLHVDTHLFKVCLQCAQWPFVSVVSFENTSVLLKWFGFFVDTIIGQMLVKILHCLLWVVIWFRSKPCKSFIIDVYTQWIDARQQYINSQVKLVVVDKQRIRDILAHNTFFVWSDLQIIQIINDVNPATLWWLWWLHYPQVIFFKSLIKFIRLAIVFCFLFL